MLTMSERDLMGKKRWATISFPKEAGLEALKDGENMEKSRDG